MNAVFLITKRIGLTLKRRWYLLVPLFVVAAFFFYRQMASQAVAEESTYTVRRQTLQQILALSGEIDAEEKVSLHFQTGGRLSWVGVKEGDIVEKYDGIASLDQRQLQKTLEKYLNTYSKERRDFEQSGDDNDDLAIALSGEIREEARRTLENAQYDLDNAVLDVELQTIAKEYSFLYSPIAGIVTHVGAAQPGMNVTVTDTYEIINPDSLYFSISVDQTEVVKLYEGMMGRITFDAYPEQTVEGTITAIGFTPKTGETGTVYEVRMAFAPVAQTAYRIGMTGDVEFILDEIDRAISIPDDYIIEEDKGTFVYKQVNGKKEQVEIQIGEEYGGMVQVTDGLFEGDVIYELP